MSKSIIVLDVTQDDLDRGYRKSTFACPIALALTRALGSDGRWALNVGSKNRWTATSPGGIRIGGALPVRTLRFITAWDRDGKGEPQQLKLWLGYP